MSRFENQKFSKQEKNQENNKLIKINSNFDIKNLIININFIIICFLCLFYYYGKKPIKIDFNKNTVLDNNKTIRFHINKIIEENFFIIDSNNLYNIDSHMYGYTVSKEGILTDNYYKTIGYYTHPEPQGVYVMIRKNGNEIKINQDYNGCFGLYIYENKDKKYFALSNSFLLLEEYLIGKYNISLNRDYINNFIITNSSSPSIFETMIKEIIKIDSNAFILINIENKSFKIYYINYNENTIPLDSNEGLKIIDKWIDKWGYILRSLRNKTDNFYTYLSGGYITRITLSILLNSGLDLTKILIKSLRDDKNYNEEDLKIANNISETFGIKLNNFPLDGNETKWNLKDTIFCIIYSKLGFNKNYYQNDGFYNKPRFFFNGIGGEIIRGFPHYNIKTLIEKLCSLESKKINHSKNFYTSSLRLCNRSINILKKKKTAFNDYEISSLFYSNGILRNNFYKMGIESFLSNIYFLQPLSDPDIKKIKFDLNKKYPHDLLAYIYIRFSNGLIHFPIQGNRTIDNESIKKAEILNKNLPSYKIKSDLNINFYIDNERKSPIPHSNDNIENKKYLKNFFKSSKFSESIHKVNKKITYRWKKDYFEKTIKADLKQKYSLLETAVAIELENLYKMNNSFLNKSFEFGKNILNYLFD
jgi:hypothetical protein